MNIEDEQWVEHALIDYERKRCMSKILSVDCKDAIPKGNNYGSDMLRLNMKVVLHSGEVVNRSIIYKALPQTETRKKFIKEANLHRKEATILTEIWPQMEKIRQDKEFGVEPISPLCYSVRRGFEGCLLEDLTEIGYKMADRTKLLDFDHAKLVVNAHAQFHALSLLLIERGDLSTSEFGDFYMRDHPKQFETLFNSALTNLATNIEEKWEPEWLCYAEKVRGLMKVVLTRFVEDLTFDESNINGLVHGDCWLTNMMFRYDSKGFPLSVRLLDFQLSNYNNITLDLQYFLNSSLNAEAQSKKPELIQLYYDKFKSSLALYGYSGDIPTFERVLECYNRANAFGLIVGLAFIPYIVQPEEAVAQDLEEWAKDIVNEKGMVCPNIDTEDFRAVMKVLLEQGSSNGIL